MRLLVLPELTATLGVEDIDAPMQYVEQAINRYWSEEPFELTINVGCASGRRVEMTPALQPPDNPSMQVLARPGRTLGLGRAVGSHSEPRVCVVPQIEKAGAAELDALAERRAASEAHAVWLGLSHET